MDSNELERERGITILSKNTAIRWQDWRINIVDTPGHADFGGEVERVLSMVDSVLLLVDAVEGPMPQTRFVTQKALEHGLAPIVVVNKIDRPGSRPDWVVDQTFELFDRLGASDSQLDFPVVYASALQGWSTLESDAIASDMQPLFQAIVDNVAPPLVDPEGSFQLQVSALDYSTYVGVIVVGGNPDCVSTDADKHRVAQADHAAVTQNQIKAAGGNGQDHQPHQHVQVKGLIPVGNGHGGHQQRQ